MFERWRRPIRVMHHEPTDEAYMTSDGRLMRGEQLTLHPDDVERIRLGYVCAKCFEPFPIAWPIRCNACGAPVAREQRQYFEHEYVGETAMPSAVDWDAEIASISERAAKEKERKK